MLKVSSLSHPHSGPLWALSGGTSAVGSLFPHHTHLQTVPTHLLLLWPSSDALTKVQAEKQWQRTQSYTDGFNPPGPSSLLYFPVLFQDMAKRIIYWAHSHKAISVAHNLQKACEVRNTREKMKELKGVMSEMPVSAEKRPELLVSTRSHQLPKLLQEQFWRKFLGCFFPPLMSHTSEKHLRRELNSFNTGITFNYLEKSQE